MSENLLYKAKRIAEKPYHFEVECEPGELSPNVPRYTAYVKEIPYCVAQGFTEAEARQEIRSVLVDYILSMLERQMPVPEPETSPDSLETEYVINWLWQDFFVHAQKCVWSHLTSPKASLQTVVYLQETDGQSQFSQYA